VYRDNEIDEGRQAGRATRRRERGSVSALDARERCVVAVNPFRCRLWDLHDRLEDYITEETCKDEIESVASHGQLVPALARPLTGNKDYDVEIIFGARRLFVARHLNIPLNVELRPMTDQEAILVFDAEDRHREDISPYERALSYAQWLKAGYFASQEDLAKGLRISASQVSRLLKLTQLPSVVLTAFQSPLSIREVWAIDLYKKWTDPAVRPMMAHRARQLRSEIRSPEFVYEQLIACGSKTGRPVRPGRDEVVLCDRGTPLFRVRRQRHCVALLLPLNRTSAKVLDRIRTAVSHELQLGVTLNEDDVSGRG